MKQSSILVIGLATVTRLDGFVSPRASRIVFDGVQQLYMQSSTSNIDESIQSMRAKDIQSELKEKGISYADCFDRESLVQRLVDVREGRIAAPVVKETTTDTPSASSSRSTNQTEFDREKVLEELRGMRAKELREECSKRRIRSVTMIEKEDLVMALLEARETASNFSVSGALTPGVVSALTDFDLEQELNSGAGTPMLLDIYATWCGPCKLMAPELEKAAEELGDAVRVAKMDSDQYPMWSSKLKVGAFPTVILFGDDGKEVQRVEGALMKDDLVRLAKSAL